MRSEWFTLKELDSQAKHGQMLKKLFGRITVFLCQKSYLQVHTSFGKFFSIMALADVNIDGTLYIGSSPLEERARAHIDQSALHPAALHRTRSGTMSLKKCVFG